ncbi:hypothetical protein R5R35_006182 [Gryllus longicercus]|uniref:Nuclear pore complex protein Nup153 n=1 Tax=Gryllus longicercus TaxID=2509291 RepID=A0AAN9VT11_9ORTH
MAKGNNNIRNKKPHSSKPYDVSNSFVKKVTSGVSSLLPQTSWLSRWFASTTSTGEDTPTSTNVGEDHEEHHSPPTKRARIPLNRSFPANSFRVSSPIDRGETHPWPSESVASPIPNVFSDSAVAGPSGLSRTPIASGPFQSTSTAVEGLDGKINGDGGSDSSESTSGCSSLAPQRAPSSSTTAAHRSSVDNKLSNHLSSYSLFPSATHKLSPSINPSLSRRRPSFNVSSFGSPNLDSSKLSRESSLNSPFYIGRTMYGGASAYRRPREGASSESFLSSTRRGGITVRPANEKTQTASAETSMSQTARRILEALEQFSSPVSDARRMPLPPQPVLGSKRKRILETSPTKSPAVPAAITNPLTIPMPPERLRLHRLQDVTEAARRIASSVSSTNKYTISDDGSLRGGTGKVTKSKPLDEDEQLLPVNLPHISLPITTLPSFDLFKMPVPTTSANSRTSNNSSKFTVKDGESSDTVEVEKSKTSCATSSTISGSSSNIVETATACSGSDPYHVTNSSVNLKGKTEKSNSMNSSVMPNSSVVSSFMAKGAPFSTVCADSGNSPMTNDYFFSTPTVLPTSRSKESIESKTSNFDFSKPEVLDSGKYTSKLKRNEPNGFHKLNSNSKVDDVKESVVLSASLKETSGKTSASQESVCGAENVATNASTTKRTQNNGWGAKFSVPDSWECSSCLVRNKKDVKICVCCGGKQPSTQSDSKNSDDKHLKKDKETPLISSGWGSNFALQSGMWECSTCLVRNKATEDKCVACSEPRPAADKPGPGKAEATATTTTTAGRSAGAGDWGSQFKLTAGKWECSACFVRNEDKDQKCVSCTTPRKTETSNKKGNDSVSGEVRSDWGQKFKKPSDSWECPVCMIRNKSSSMKCDACEEPKPGIDTNRSSTGSSIKFNFEMPSGASNFKFGIDKAELKQSESVSATVSATFTFGGSTKTEASGAPAQMNFKFGAPSAENKIPSGIKFGISPAVESCVSVGKQVSKVGESVTPASSENTSSQTLGLSQKPLQQSETSKTSGISFGIPTSENTGESKALANANESDSLRKDLQFTVSQSPLASSIEEANNKGTSFATPVQNTEQKNVKDVKPSFNFGSASPASVTSSTSLASSASVSSATTKAGGFTFALNTLSSAATTSVAVTTTANVAAPISSTPSSLFAFGSNSTSFKPTTSAPAFSFGTPSVQTTASGIFGAAAGGQFKSSSEGVFSNKSVAPAAAVFGGSSPVPPKSASLPSFGSITTSPTSVTSTTITTTTTTTTATSVSTFGNSASVFSSPSATTASVTFGSGMTKPVFANVNSGFGSVTTAGGIPSTTTVTTTNNTSVPTSSFPILTTSGSFVVPASTACFSTTVPTYGSSTTPSGFGVGTTTASVPTTVPSTQTPAPSFGPPPPVAFGATTTTGNSFGTNNVTQSFSTTATNVFGSSNPPTFGSASTPAFGAASGVATFGNTFGGATTTAPAFGTVAQTVTTTSSTPSLSSFGGFANASKPTQGIFLFGSNPATTTQSSNFFNVGSQTSGGQGTLPGSAAFTFGPGAASSATNVTTSTNTTPTATAAVAPAAATPTFGGFSFTGGASAAASGAPAPSLFGNAAPPPPVFGTPSVPSATPATPAFGAASVPTANVFKPPSFNFPSGGAQQPFSFGSSAQPGTTPATGFSFGQGQPPTQSQSQPLQFNPNVRPTFNFTGGETPQFTASAPAAPSPNPQRRVKKAVRRTQRP